MARSANILLVNPWIYDFTAYDFWLKPMGLLYIASILEKHASCRVDLVDCLDRGRPELAASRRSRSDGRGPYPKETVPKPEALKAVPRRFSRYGIPVPLFLDDLDSVPVPDLVLMTCTMTYWYPGVQAAIDLVKRKFGNVPVVLGGVYPTLMPEHAAAQSGADRIVRGPGENAILPLVEEILGGGICGRPEFTSLDDLPAPDYRLLRDRSWLPILSSRGCPFRCSFCASPILHPGFEQRPASSVVEEIEHWAGTCGTGDFAFYDDALCVDKEKHLVPILRGILDRKLDLSFHTPNGLHIREIDESLARLFRRAGVKSIFLSQESTDESLLLDRSPKVRPGDLEKALDCLEKAGYDRSAISVYLIAGLPGQRAESVVESVRRVRELRAIPRLALFSPVPGTREWDDLCRRGVLSQASDPLLHNKTVLPYLWGDLSFEELAGIRKLADARAVAG
ncbi:MAG: B12-binding domain-containing radical SAM protein [Candidatus Aminicenantales bacterium]